jgi:hypothetical protein
MIHTLLAGISQMPEWELDKSESEQLASAVASVTRHYPSFQTSEKASDWINLGICAAFVYGGRFRVMTQRAKERRAARPAPATANGAAPPPGTRTPPAFNEVDIPGVGRVLTPTPMQ